MNISVVVPVHNEERYLPIFLEGLRGCNGINEAVFVLDRCSDRSREIIEAQSLPFKVNLVEVKRKTWRNQIAETVRIGCESAQGELVYVLNAGILVNSKMFDVNWDNLDFCSFGLKEHHADLSKALVLNLRGIVGRDYEVLKQRMRHRSYGSGIYAFRRSIYKVVQHQDYDAEDSLFLTTCMDKGFRYHFFRKIFVWHLRPNNPQNDQRRAKYLVNEYHVGFLRASWYALKFMNPNYFREYAKERAKKVTV